MLFVNITVRASSNRVQGLYIPGEPGRIGLTEVVEMAGDEFGGERSPIGRALRDAGERDATAFPTRMGAVSVRRVWRRDADQGKNWKTR